LERVAKLRLKLSTSEDTEDGRIKPEEKPDFRSVSSASSVVESLILQRT